MQRRPCPTCRPPALLPQCPASVTNCATYTTDGSNACICSACDSGFTKSPNSLKCCANIASCTAYSNINCKCTTCTTGTLSATGTQCCSAITNCGTYSDTDCSCTACATGELLPAACLHGSTALAACVLGRAGMVLRCLLAAWLAD